MERWSGVDGINLNFSEEEEYIETWLNQRLIYTDSLFEYNPILTPIENIDSNRNTTVKIIRDGHMYILRGDKTYTITGAVVK